MGGVELALTVFDDGVGVAEMDLGGGEQGQAPVVVMEVVPVEESVAVSDGLVEAVELRGKVGPVLEGLEGGLTVGVVVADPGPAVAAGERCSG